MFCMSERGHGSNVRGITTEAHYDASTQVGHVSISTLGASIRVSDAKIFLYQLKFFALLIDSVQVFRPN